MTRVEQPIDWKGQAQKQWNATPCGSVGEITEDLRYFREVETNRYDVYAPWMRSAFGFENWGGRDVLEIGFGQGTDLAQYAVHGARCHGVDITPRHVDLARRNFESRGLQADLRLHDAANLPFDVNRFDRIHSFGVLHHTPDTERCIAEAHRVLRPGGELLLGMYHRWSAFHLCTMLLDQGLIGRRLFRLGYRGLLSTLEEGADGIEIKPLVKLYSRRQLRRMLGAFGRVEIRVHHLDKSHFGRMRRLLPRAMVRRLESRLGWYLVARAVK